MEKRRIPVRRLARALSSCIALGCAKRGAAPPERVKLDAHMPGRWEFVFEIGAERLTDSIRVE